MKNRSGSENAKQAPGRFAPPAWLVGLVTFVVIALLNFATLHDPPTWDGAMGVHPAAITLSRSGFDLPGLLRQPRYMQGGPNTHSMSVVTWLTAVFYRLLAGSDWLFPVMHVCHFALAAIAVAGVYRFARPVLGDPLAATLCAVVAFNPIVLAQSGCLYLEIPLLAATMAALRSWANRNWLAAAFWTLVTFYIKETGLILAAALGAAALIEGESWRRRMGHALVVLVPSIVAFFLNAALTRPPGATAYVPPPFREYVRFNVVQRLMPVPDLCVALGLFLLVTLFQSVAVWRCLRQPEAAKGDADDRRTMARPVAVSHLMVLSFLAFFLAAPFATEVYLLPRYFVQIFPCLALNLVGGARRIAPDRAVLAGAVACSLLFLANREGFFYSPKGFLHAPIDTNDGSAAERSLEYRDLLQVQREALQKFEETAPDAPVFYGYPEHFLVNYPEMAFVSRRPAKGRCVMLDPPARAADLPDSFYVLLDYPALGGRTLMAIYEQAYRLRWNIRQVGDFRQGYYRARLLEISLPSDGQRRGGS